MASFFTTAFYHFVTINDIKNIQNIIQYEKEKRYIEQISAQTIWMKILEAQIETGTPYILPKDHINNKSNQKSPYP